MFVKMYRNWTIPTLLLIALMISACDNDGSDSVNGVDVRGVWFLMATHQSLSDSHMVYQFRMTENRDHTVQAEAERIIFDSVVWPAPIMVDANISFNRDQVEIEFVYPDETETERVTGTIIRVDSLGGIAGATNLHYSGAIEGPLLRSPNPERFNTSVVTLDKISD